MKIITDLSQIKKIAAKKEDENWEYRSYLKSLSMPTEEIDAVVHHILAEVTAAIDCTQCANCCKEIRPTLDEEDIYIFADGLKLTVDEFREQYLTREEDHPSIIIFNDLPCPFLIDLRCGYYPNRPKECQSYPHLHKSEFTSRSISVLLNYEICPIVFNVFEQLKREL
jgi:Fe-S-cluster containining protein